MGIINKTYTGNWINEIWGSKVEIYSNAQGINSFIGLFKIGHHDLLCMKQMIINNWDQLEKEIEIDVPDDLIENFLSAEVGLVLKKLEESKNPDKLILRDVFCFYVDFLIPASYEKAQYVKYYLGFDYMVVQLKMMLGKLPDSILKTLFQWCFPNDEYRELKITREEALPFEIKKYTGLSEAIQIYADDTEITFERLATFKGKIPSDLYLYCFKKIYLFNTRGVSIDVLHRCTDGLSRDELMNISEKKIYESLPDAITIYRGTDNDEIEPRFSWSLSKEVALKFANGNQLMVASVEKKRIVTLYDTDEKEVMVWVNENEVTRKCCI